MPLTSIKFYPESELVSFIRGYNYIFQNTNHREDNYNNITKLYDGKLEFNVGSMKITEEHDHRIIETLYSKLTAQEYNYVEYVLKSSLLYLHNILDFNSLISCKDIDEAINITCKKLKQRLFNIKNIHLNFNTTFKFDFLSDRLVLLNNITINRHNSDDNMTNRKSILHGLLVIILNAYNRGINANTTWNSDLSGANCLQKYDDLLYELEYRINNFKLNE